ncbi:MAG: hypothetical protein KatS3mg087_1776 [Patescibacteria group bacterium]|nr:MAG: hypothetical protein KatS3mg087_1776 [Patescibacteria group bacterium]
MSRIKVHTIGEKKQADLSRLGGVYNSINRLRLPIVIKPPIAH